MLLGYFPKQYLFLSLIWGFVVLWEYAYSPSCGAFQVLSFICGAVGPLSEASGCCRLTSTGASPQQMWRGPWVGGAAISSTRNDCDGSSWLRARVSCQSVAKLLSLTGLRCACHFLSGRGRGRGGTLAWTCCSSQRKVFGCKVSQKPN